MSHPLKQYITDIPDFPKPGILFRDINPLLRNHFTATIQALSELITPTSWEKIDAVVGIESRGFILAAGLAAQKEKGFIPIRKPGKLPGSIESESYQLEYGQDTLEMESAQDQKRVLLVDDVLATGGTLTAAIKLAAKTGHQVHDLMVLINLKNLNQLQWQHQPIKTLIEYA